MKQSLWLLFLSIIFSTFAVEFFAPFYVVFVQGIGGTLIIAGSTWAIYKLGSALFMIVSGRLADSIGSKNMMVIGHVIRIVGTAGYFFITSVWHLFLIQIIHSIAHASILPGYRKLYSKNEDRGQEGREWSYAIAMEDVVVAFAIFLGGVTAEYFGFTSIFVIMLVAHSISLLIAVKIRLSKKIFE
jgi:MFS family permease